MKKRTSKNQILLRKNTRGEGVKALKSFITYIIPIFLIFYVLPMQAQDCIDIEQIKTDLSNIQDKCSCADPLVLGEEDQVVEISTYQLGPLVENECIEVFGTLVIDHGGPTQ